MWRCDIAIQSDAQRTLLATADESHSWVHGVGKDRIAQLARHLFDAADELMLGVPVVMDKLQFSQLFDVVLSGGMLAHQPTFFESLRNRFQNIAPTADVCLLKHEPAYGTVMLTKSRFFK